MSWHILQGDARQIPLRDGSVDCCVTSPPYYSLRQYETSRWQGGDALCSHSPSDTPATRGLASSTLGGGKKTTGHQQEGYRGACPKCGAVRVDHQIGLEATVGEYVSQLVSVFREVKRVLSDNGCLFLNLSDTYRDKQLCGVPWKVAFALQDDGWILRQEITYCKKAPMPESVRDRFTSATEKIFLLTKNERYYFDSEAVKEPACEPERERRDRIGGANGHLVRHSVGGMVGASSTRHMRNYWLLGPEPTSFQHFATMPTEIVKRCVLAGSSEKGCCGACGAPHLRVVEKESVGQVQYYEGKHSKADLQSASARMNANLRARRNHGGDHDNPFPSARTLGWRPSCSCGAPIRPAIVLDPFAGSCTTGLVASRLGRDFIGLELSRTYCEMGRKRIIEDAPLFVNTPARPAPAAEQGALWR